jgi:protocatechuate 3,4-dioxygenase, alpha subunit
MSTNARLTPYGSQTVGPFFHIGLDYLLERAPKIAGTEHAIRVQGRVLDRDGRPVPDALLEFWSPHPSTSAIAAQDGEAGFPSGFHRAPTDDSGAYSIVMHRPAGDESAQAPHMLVLVFARGLLRHLISRVYFEGEAANENDPVLLAVPAARRGTLIARRDGQDAYQWDVVLQGDNETVFFAW